MTNLLFILTVTGTFLAAMGIVTEQPFVYLFGAAIALASLYRSFTGGRPA